MFGIGELLTAAAYRRQMIKEIARVRMVPEKRMEPGEVKQAVAEIVGTDGWRALHQELDATIADAVDEVSRAPDVRYPDKNRDFDAGGGDWLRKFQAVMLDLERVTSGDDREIE